MLPDLFEAQVAGSAATIALTLGDQQHTYGQLDAAANRLARHIIAAGVGPEDLVVVALDRSLDMITAILAILKSGAAYVPLDPSYPDERLNFVIRDCGAKLGLTTFAIGHRLNGTLPWAILDDPETKNLLSAYSELSPAQGDRKSPLGPENLAYVIYTSGSTGTPKGVGVTHQNVVRLFSATDHWFGFGPNDVWTLFHSYGFDFSVWEIWGALLYGARLVIVSEDTRLSPRDFLTLLVREKVTVLNQTPTAFYQLSEVQAERNVQTPDLRYVIFGGEALEFRKLQRWYANHADDAPKLINMYGITETTVHVTYLALDAGMAAEASESLIGASIPDLGVHLLDENLSPVSEGNIGEICVTGAGVARGYVNRPELTAQRFLPDPYGPNGARMYRSGDLARRRPDGGLEFHGRADQQVKIRGFRIELGEIEAALAGINEVGQAAVTVRDLAGEPSLVAYLTPRSGMPLPSDATLRATLARALPRHAIPAGFVRLAALPLTVNGKLDRAALPAPKPLEYPSGISENSNVFQSITETEQKLRSLFSKILRIHPPGLSENFFDLGGNSMLGIQLVYDIEKSLGKKLPMSTLYLHSTVEKLALKIDHGAENSIYTSLVPIYTDHPGVPIFMVHWVERDLARALGMRRPVFGLSLGMAVGDRDDESALPERMEDIAAHYVHEMRLVQPEGPYQLIGHSAGGLIAFEMAQQLAAIGQSVSMLGLLDSAIPLKKEERVLLPLGAQIRNILRTPLPRVWSKARKIIFRRFEQLPFKVKPNMKYLMNSVLNRINYIENIIEEYDPKPYPGRINLFKSMVPAVQIRTASAQPIEWGWKNLAGGGLVVHDIPGDHMAIVKHPLAEMTAAKLEACLIPLETATT